MNLRHLLFLALAFAKIDSAMSDCKILPSISATVTSEGSRQSEMNRDGAAEPT